jgi:hypothetical protein
MKKFLLVLAATLGFWGIAHANDSGEVIGTETVRSTDSNGVVTEKRIIKKMRSRTVVDFEEASIEGKIKKPNAAYLLHGADLDFKHLYRIKQNQKEIGRT